MDNLDAKDYKNFEGIKHVDENGKEYWLASELALVLGYDEWPKFSKEIERAMLACEKCGFEICENFDETGKTAAMPLKSYKGNKKAKVKTISDYRLTRYACHFIVENDPRKAVRALGQTYFTIYYKDTVPRGDTYADKMIEAEGNVTIHMTRYYRRLFTDGCNELVRYDVKAMMWSILCFPNEDKTGAAVR